MASRDPKSGHEFKFTGGLGYFEYFIIFFRLVQYLKKERLENIYISFEVTQAQLIELFWLHQNHNKNSKMPASKLKV